MSTLQTLTYLLAICKSSSITKISAVKNVQIFLQVCILLCVHLLMCSVRWVRNAIARLHKCLMQLDKSIVKLKSIVYIKTLKHKTFCLCVKISKVKLNINNTNMQEMVKLPMTKCVPSTCKVVLVLLLTQELNLLQSSIMQM